MKTKSKQKVRCEDRLGSIDDGNFQGTAVSYAVGPTPTGGFDLEAHLCDYDISDLETYLDQTRAARLRAKRRGKRPKPLPLDAFNGDVFVLVGPNISPERAIKALERVIQSIRSSGLLIGRDTDGDHLWEPIEPKKSNKEGA